MENTGSKAIRKNIYIPEDSVDNYKKAEEYAKTNDMSMSNLILDSVKYYIEEKTKENDGYQEIVLLIKESNPEGGFFGIPDIKKIKFVGRFIYKTINPIYDNNLISYNEGEIKFDYHTAKHHAFNKDNYDSETDVVFHNYIIYQTKKGKLFVYIGANHNRNIEGLDGMGDYYNNTVVICDELKYKVYDTAEDMLIGLWDLPSQDVNNIALMTSRVEELDI